MDLLKTKRWMPYMCFCCCAPATPLQPLQRCGGCQLAAYCSKDCQKESRFPHKPICKMFPVVNGINALHTTIPWEEHFATLRKRAALLPEYSIPLVDRALIDPKVCNNPMMCNTCRETCPSLLTMCKCEFVSYCSKKCAMADISHKEICSRLYAVAQRFHLQDMRDAYPLTLFCALEDVCKENQKQGDNHRIQDIVKLKIHVVTNKTYYDAKAWEKLFHQDELLKLEQLELVFIIKGSESNSSFDFQGASNQAECNICPQRGQKAKDHIIDYSIHMKPYHMFFSSSDYTEPDLVIVYGVTDVNNDIHSDISFRNMTHSKDSVLVLTDSSFDLVDKGSLTAHAARPMDVIVKPIRNDKRLFGSNKSGMEYDAYATNEKKFYICLKRK